MADYKAQHNYESRISLGESVPLETPLVIYVEVSSFCNLECGFCPQHLSPQQIPKEKMKLDRFEEMCRQINQFPSKPKLIRFCGIGDSLTNNTFIDMLKIANQYKIGERMQLITNGLLLPRHNCDELINLLDQIVISIEGLSDDDYKKFAHRTIDFEAHLLKLRALCAIKERRARFNIKIHSAAVKTEERLERFNQLFSFADEIFVENLVNLWPELESDLGENPSNIHRFLKSDIKQVVACPQIFKSLQVNASGVVIPCCIDWSLKNNLGNIDKMTLVDIWNGEKLRDLRLKHLNNERNSFSPCNQCTMNEFTELDSIDNDLDKIKEKILSSN